MGVIPPVGAVPHSATFDFSPLVFVSVPLRLKENAFADPTEASDSCSLSSSFVLATWREAREESKEAQQEIFRTVLNREAKSWWWDIDAVSVSLKLFQSSCFNHGAHDDPTLRRSHPVKTLLWGTFLLMAIESKPFGDGSALAGKRRRLWISLHIVGKSFAGPFVQS
jgi:hypothetical protein